MRGHGAGEGRENLDAVSVGPVVAGKEDGVSVD